MHRGHRIAYLNLLDEEEKPVKQSRGRHLIQERNLLLIYRHYYYIKLQRIQYADSIRQLVTEFHLSENTIINILVGSGDLRMINNEKPDVSQLRKKYPFFNW